MDERTKDERRTDELTIRDLMQKNATLTAEVKRLEEKIGELEDEIEAISAEAEENKHAQLADATTSTIGQLAQVLPDLVDKYFKIQEQKNALLAEQMMRQRPPMRPQPQEPVQGPQNGQYYYED
jgi:septal ring factor EnvC (AmiA/AmiB activator)